MYSHVLSYLEQFVHVGRVPLHRYHMSVRVLEHLREQGRKGEVGLTSFLLRQNAHALGSSARPSRTRKRGREGREGQEGKGESEYDLHPSPYRVESTRLKDWCLILILIWSLIQIRSRGVGWLLIQNRCDGILESRCRCRC